MSVDQPRPEQVKQAIHASGATWLAGETSLSNLPASELQRRLGYTPGPGEPSLSEREQASQAREAQVTDAGAPTQVDLRNIGGQNFVTPIRDQGNCGSCVSFGVTATVEATVQFRKNTPNSGIDLSEAQLFYCVARQQGRTCENGWWPDQALAAYQSQGICDEACYPYVAGDQNCSNLCADWQQRVRKIDSYATLSNTGDMKAWLATKGALTTCFTVYNDFFSYVGGVYRHVTGDVAGGHCVSVVGYDENNQCWICKNSWGPGWGEQGFFRIRYGECGIDATMWGVNVVGGTPPGPQGSLYRYWNPTIGDHFYTTDWNELGDGAYGWGFEGVQCYVATQQIAGTMPLYRYWNPAGGDHFYTTNWAELGNGEYGYGFEGIQCYVWGAQDPGTVPLYRYFSAGASDHFYTTSWSELGSGNYGYGFEGIQCYVATSPITSQAMAPDATKSVPHTFKLRAGRLNASQGQVDGAPPQASGGRDVPASFRVSPATPASASAIPSTFRSTAQNAQGAPAPAPAGTTEPQSQPPRKKCNC